MMNDNNMDNSDRKLRDLFHAARRADAVEVPEFQQTVHAARGRDRDDRASSRRPWVSRGLRVAFGSAVGGIAVAATAFWLFTQPPAPVIPDIDAVRSLIAKEHPPAPSVEIAGTDEPVVPAMTPPTAAAAPPEVAPGQHAPAATSDTVQKTIIVKKYVPPPGDRLTEEQRATAPATTPAEDLSLRVDVTARRSVIDFEKATTVTKLSGHFVADLPTRGRSYENTLTLAPGVATNLNTIGEVEVITGGARIHGSRARHFSETGSEAAPATGFNTEGYRPIEENPFLTVAENPLSTFSIDVDTASYANMRRFINQGALPPRDAVRIEELLNYFSYDDAPPKDDAPFAARIEVADCPWQPAHRLARIGLKARTVSRGEIGGSNLVFLIDVSGSMLWPNKLPLLRSALSLLVDQLDGRDQVAIVVYAGASGLVLPSTPGSARGEIQSALANLSAGGSTNGGAGLALAYKTARENFIPGGVNRVILATDGDFNVGTTTHGELLQLIEKDAKAGVFLTVLGFGMGNYKDDRLEHLANRGNGNYAYIDDLREAQKVLVEEIGGTLVTVAKDVKIQVEFNPAHVGAYRLIGYENRMLRKEDFNDDTKDAGEIGAGHSVTALYELIPPGVESGLVPAVDALKYQQPARPTREAAASRELLTLALRFKDPESDTSRHLSFGVEDEGRSLAAASPDFKFAAAVAGFGMILRDSTHRGSLGFDDVQALARQGLGADSGGYRAEFLSLVSRAQALAVQQTTDPNE